MNITVTAVNDAPVANDDSLATPANTPVTIDVVANDTRGPANENNQNLTVTIEVQPSNGTAAVNPNQSVTYIPDLTVTGSDSFVYKICDTGVPSLCDTATVTVNVG